MNSYGLKGIILDLDLNNETKILLNQNLGCSRLIYNTCLGYKLAHYESQINQGIDKKDIKYIGLKELSKEVSDIRNNDEDYDFLKDCKMSVLQQAMMNQETAWTNFFKNNSGFPKFKAKHNDNSCKFIKQGLPTKIFENDKLNLTKTLFDIKFRCSDNDRKYLLDHPDLIHSITVKRTKAGKYTASICIERVEKEYIKPKYNSIGLDLGIKNFVVDSRGNFINPSENFTEAAEHDITKLSRQHSKKKKGSSNREKSRIKLVKKHAHIANARKDFLHKVSYHIVIDNQVICMENLNVKGMIKNHNLSKALSNQGLGMFKTFIIYKAKWYVREVIEISRWFPSSKKCSNCGNIKHDLKLSDRIYHCDNCGMIKDRDMNAGENIEVEGLRIRVEALLEQSV